MKKKLSITDIRYSKENTEIVKCFKFYIYGISVFSFLMFIIVHQIFSADIKTLNLF